MNNRIDEDLERAQNLLKIAKREKKGDYRIYNAYKIQLDSLLLPFDVYQKMVRELCNILKV